MAANCHWILQKLTQNFRWGEISNIPYTNLKTNMWILKIQKIIALEKDFQLSTIFFVYYFFWKISIQVYRGSGSFAPKHRPFSTSTPHPLNPSAHFDWKVSSDLPNVALRHYTTCVFGLFLLAFLFIGLPEGRPKTQSNKQKARKNRNLWFLMFGWKDMLCYWSQCVGIVWAIMFKVDSELRQRISGNLFFALPRKWSKRVPGKEDASNQPIKCKSLKRCATRWGPYEL